MARTLHEWLYKQNSACGKAAVLRQIQVWCIRSFRGWFIRSKLDTI